jgi:uncharacterized protein YjaZ
MLNIALFEHYRHLFPNASAGYRDKVQVVLASSFAQEPWLNWVQACFRHRCLGIPDEDTEGITQALAQLCKQPVEEVAKETLVRMNSILPLEMTSLECHLYPSEEPNASGGMSFAPGKMLIAVPTGKDWAIQVQRNCVHEYSHSLRMALWPQDQRHGYGPAVSYNLRHYLIFEGLAITLENEIYPRSENRDEINPQQEEQYWLTICPHIEETGWPAYINYILCAGHKSFPVTFGYQIGAKIVQSYKEKHNIRSMDIQRLPYDEIYWNSNYQYIC